MTSFTNATLQDRFMNVLIQNFLKGIGSYRITYDYAVAFSNLFDIIFNFLLLFISQYPYYCFYYLRRL